MSTQINKNLQPSDLEVAKKIAQRYIANPELNGKKITDILVLNKDHAVFVNTPVDQIKDYAQRIKCPITVVMKDGKVLDEKTVITVNPTIPKEDWEIKEEKEKKRLADEKAEADKRAEAKNKAEVGEEEKKPKKK